MEKIVRTARSIVAWVWLLSILLALLELRGTIEFSSPQLCAVVRAIPWLLVFPASQHFGISRWLGCSLWLGLVGVAVLGVLTFFMGGILLIQALFFFFGGANAWNTSFVYSEANFARYVKQVDISHRDSRDIVLLSITPWVRIPVAPSIFDVQHWTPVQKDFAYFGPDSAKQRAEDQRASRFRFCTKQRARLDSLDRLHLLPPQVLLPATQQGAGTLGCVLGRQVWCVPMHPAPEPIDCSATKAMGWETMNGHVSFIMQADRLYDSFYIDLPYPLPRKPGNWPATLSIVWAWRSANNQPATWGSAPGAAVVTVTRLDTVAHIIAGTFTGTLYRPYPKDRTKRKKIPYGQMERMQVSQGRFDLRYEPGLYHETP